MSTMPLVTPYAVIFNAFKYIQRLPHHTLTTQNLPFTDIFASPNSFLSPKCSRYHCANTEPPGSSIVYTQGIDGLQAQGPPIHIFFVS